MRLTAYSAALLLLLLAQAQRLPAQEYVVAVAEENFRARPNGPKLGTLRKGAALAALDENGRWVKASLRGWIWKKSVKSSGRKATLLVSVASENLRASPAPRGRLLGTVLRSTSLQRLAERTNWLQVKYDGWIWEPSLAAGATKPATGDQTGAAKAEAAAGGGGRAATARFDPDRTLGVREENLRSAPNGSRLGKLRSGADLAVLGSRGSWLEVGTRGYFWAASAKGSGASRTVAKATENLRMAPGSEIVGVLDRGTPLDVIGRAGRWLEVELEGWIWEPSTLALEGSARARGKSTGAPPEERAPEEALLGRAGEPPPARAGDSALPARTLARSVPLKDGPNGALVGQALTGSSVVPLRSEGDWVKIRFEGWVPRDALGASSGAAGPATIPMVITDPAAYRGAAVTWRLELIAVAQADRSRSDFAVGEHYLLTRNAAGEREYVYVVIPARLAAGFQKMRPFIPLTIRGVIRTGRSALVGNPILEYRELIEQPR